MFQILSPYMLKTYEICPKKFQFQYEKGISMPSNNDIFESGKNIHALASYYLRGEEISKMENVLKCKELEMWNFLKNIKYFSYEVINTEYNLSFKLNNVFFGGRLDALVKQDSSYYILDYKTGHVPQNAEFDYQTIIYMLAVSIFYKTEDVYFVYIDLKNKKELQIKLNKNLMEQYKSKLIEISNSMSEHKYISKSLCDKSICEYGIICF